MNPFLSALNAVLPHFRVRADRLMLSQGHPFDTTEFDLRRLMAHQRVGPSTLRLRSRRGGWTEFSLEGFRPAEIRRLRGVLRQWERLNHAPQPSDVNMPSGTTNTGRAVARMDSGPG